ncbi:MAG: cyclic nucleotide-binding domain-containing protein [Chloroflexota bacterium]
MPDRYQESHIRQVPLFSHLPEHQFQLIARAFGARRYNQGDYVLIQDTPVPGMLIVGDGQLAWGKTDGSGTVIDQGVIHAGQAIYQQAMTQALNAESHLQALVPTTMLVLTRDALSNLLSHHPELRSPLGLADNRDHHLHDVHFRTQRENEEVLLKTRRHWFSMMRWMWAPIVFILLGLLLSAFVSQIAIFTVPLVFLFGGIIIAYVILEWINDSVIVTDQRVIRITHTILLFREVRNEVMLQSIQEANAEIPTFDLFARLFRYGDVELKTAGSQGNFVLDFLPNPEAVQDLILEDARQARTREQFHSRAEREAEIDRWINNDTRGGKQSATSMPQAGVSEKRLKDPYSPGDGPASPFVTTFASSNGGVVYRKHWFIWMKMIAMPAIWVFGSLIAMILLGVTALGNLGVVGWASAFVAFLIGAVWFYLADWDWRHDYYLITDNNITIVNQRPLWLQNESDQVLLQQVDNVVAETSGLFQQIFRFGDVRVSLVGADNHKLFDDVANPRDIQSEITRRQQRLKQREREQQERAQREAIGEYLSIYHQKQQEDSQTVPAQPEQPTASPYSPTAQRPYQSQSRNQPSPSPLGNRPTISQGRQYIPTSNSPQQRPVQPQQGQYHQPQQTPYPPQQRPIQPQQGQYHQPHSPVQPQQTPYPPQVPQRPPAPPNPYPSQQQSSQSDNTPPPPPPPFVNNN